MTNIEKVIHKHLGTKNVEKILVSHDEDIDGESIIRVKVVYSTDVEELPVETMAKVTNELWEILRKEDQEALPLLSYISAEDTPELNAA
ncbi:MULTISPECIES: hypothetical protein [unclassified Roseovarius]|uniref:hypothetical protein n=1 Tax=unclassified Roseovarius TaxID=2614913 RepID=UPI00273E3A44|nr:MULTISPECIES: hypothetical protein [unclassified Roseovarius]